MSGYSNRSLASYTFGSQLDVAWHVLVNMLAANLIMSSVILFLLGENKVGVLKLTKANNNFNVGYRVVCNVSGGSGHSRVFGLVRMNRVDVVGTLLAKLALRLQTGAFGRSMQITRMSAHLLTALSQLLQ